MTPKQEQDVLSNLSEIDSIFETKIFALNKEIIKNGQMSPLFNAALTRVLILARDLVAKAQTSGTPEGKLIKYGRDSMCHIDSGNHYSDKATASRYFGIIMPEHEGMMLTASNPTSKQLPGNETTDDLAFIIGEKRIYLNGDIVSTINKTRAMLAGQITCYTQMKSQIAQQIPKVKIG